MPIVKDKYRGTKEYHQLYAELITAARYRGNVTYQEIARMMGLPPTGNHMGREVGYILGEISEDEQQRKRPMLSAVAVGVEGKAGEGFFGLAQELGRLSDESPEAKRRFWEEERSAVYKTWCRPLG